MRKAELYRLKNELGEDQFADKQPWQAVESFARRRADQFSIFRSTGILPVAEKHRQDACATANAVTQLEQLIGPVARRGLIDSGLAAWYDWLRSFRSPARQPYYSFLRKPADDAVRAGPSGIGSRHAALDFAAGGRFAPQFAEFL